MKKPAECLYKIWLLGLFLAFGCNLHNNQNTAELLDEQPYAPITDSIGRFPQEASLYLRRAELLTQHNQYEMAYPDFKKSWELDATEKTAFEFASNLSITGKTDEAANFLNQCISRFPQNTEFKRSLTEVYLQTGKTTQALSLFDGLLKSDSADADAWYEKGKLLEKLRDTPRAIACLKMAFRLKPTATYTLELADMYAETNNAAALALCDEIIRQDSPEDLTDPFFIKGIYFSNTHQYDDAITQFDSCIHRDWKLTDAYIEKGIAFFKQKNYDNAMNTFRMAASVSFDSPDAYFWIGRCYEAINKKDDAAQYYQKAILLDRNFTEAIEALKRVS